MKCPAYYNGTILPLEELSIPAMDRAVYFGDGVYDVAYGKNGKYFRIDDHLNRFFNSCRLLEINLGLTHDELLGELDRLLACCDDTSSFVIYFQASRGTAPREHSYPENARANLMMFINSKKLADLTHPIQLITADDIRYSMCNVKTINLIPNVMANEKAKEAGCAEAVFIRDGRVTEGSHSNVHILKDGKFITAPLDNHILPGIARSHLILLCGQLGIPVEERIYTPEELENADEILVSSTTTLCRRADRLNGKPVGGKAVALYETLRDAYLHMIDECCR